MPSVRHQQQSAYLLGIYWLRQRFHRGVSLLGSCHFQFWNLLPLMQMWALMASMVIVWIAHSFQPSVHEQHSIFAIIIDCLESQKWSLSKLQGPSIIWSKREKWVIIIITGICSGTSTEWLFVHWVWKISLCLSHERVTGVRRNSSKITSETNRKWFCWELYLVLTWVGVAWGGRGGAYVCSPIAGRGAGDWPV
mgnify:CR=1 FL=1